MAALQRKRKESKQTKSAKALLRYEIAKSLDDMQLIGLQRSGKIVLKKIGKGLEFNVFDLGNGRVLKKPTTKRQKRKFFRQWYPNETKAVQEKRLYRAEKSTQYSLRNLSRHVLKAFPTLLGNPLFLKNLQYTQDKVQPLGKYFKSHTFSENKLILHSYTNCIFQQWEAGFFQKVSNFTINYGVDAKGKVILMDLGELTFSKAEVASRIKKKTWLANWSYLKMKDKKLKRYYARLLDAELTLEKLNRLWKAHKQ